jgi:hypothetical protein
MQGCNHKPPLLRWLFSVCLVLVLAACATAERSGTGQATVETSPNEAGTIVFTNRTPFTVHLVRGSGRIDVITLSPNSSGTVSNIAGAEETYYPLFDIPLTKSYSLSRIRPENINFHYQIDNRKAHQEIDITIPESFSGTAAYIIFTNNSRSGGVSLSRNQNTSLMTGINFQESKSNVNEGETLIYQENPQELRSLRINPRNISFGEMAYQGSYAYYFSFDGSSVILTDARPLHEIGGPAPFTVEFNGNFSSNEKDTILNALQDGLDDNNVLLRLHLDSDAETYFKFVVSGEDAVSNLYGQTLIRWKQPGLTVQFMYSSVISENFSVAEINRDRLISVTGNEIRNRASFFLRVKEAIDR